MAGMDVDSQITLQVYQQRLNAATQENILLNSAVIQLQGELDIAQAEVKRLEEARADAQPAPDEEPEQAPTGK